MTPEQIAKAREYFRIGRSLFFVAAQLDIPHSLLVKHRAAGDLPPGRQREAGNIGNRAWRSLDD